MNVCKVFYSRNLISRNNFFQGIKSENVHRHFLNKKINNLVSRNFSSYVIDPEVFDSGKLKENKQIADEIIYYVRNHIKKVATRGIEPPFAKEKLQNLIQINEIIAEQRSLREQIYQTQTQEKQNTFVAYDIAAYLAKKSGCGNCGEMVSTGLMHFHEISSLGRTGMFAIHRSENAQFPHGISYSTSNGHAFLIVGLSSNGKLTNDDQSFGVNAVIADPFSQEESYPLSDMNIRLENYYGLDPLLKPVSAKIEPKIDTIHLICSNIFSANEFIEPFLTLENSPTDAIEIANLLNSFNASTSKESRIPIANEIINKIPLVHNTLDETCKHLKEQLDLFKQSLPQEVDESLIPEIDFQIRKFVAAGEQMNACEDNICSLRSQLEKFKNPTSLSFELLHP